jgi:hypothetical protein
MVAAAPAKGARLEFWSNGVLESRSNKVSHRCLLRVACYELRVKK